MKRGFNDIKDLKGRLQWLALNKLNNRVAAIGGQLELLNENLSKLTESYTAFTTKYDPMIRYTYMVCKKQEIMRLAGVEERANPWNFKPAVTGSGTSSSGHGSSTKRVWAPAP